MYVKTHRMSRAESQARTRALLLASGRRLFIKKGYNAATVDEISENAGFSRGAFYANFDDKADLFLRVFDEERARDFAELSGIVEETPDTELLPRMGEWFMRILVNGPLQRAVAEFHLAVHSDPAHRRGLAENARAVRDVSAGMIGRYRQSHGIELTVDDETFATMVTATIGGFADELRLDPGAATLETIGLTLTALWNGVLRS